MDIPQPGTPGMPLPDRGTGQSAQAGVTPQPVQAGVTGQSAQAGVTPQPVQAGVTGQSAQAESAERSVPREPLHTRTGRDRHGRGARGPLLPVGVPRYRTRSMAFDQLVLEMYAPLHNSYFEQLSGVDLAVDTIPRMRLRDEAALLGDEVVADGPVPLGRVLAAGVDRDGNPTRARLVVFRHPVEQRARGTEERAELVSWILTALVASYLNLEPRDIDPGFPW